MIEELEIRGLGVIDHTVLPLQSGFTAITGETGAGKTMIVAALGLLMGARSDAGAVRRGADRARVTGTLHTGSATVEELVADVGGEVESGELLLTRTVSAEGRSRATVGGTPAPAATLAALAPHLFAVHGQAEQHRLKSPAAQRDMLDRFGGEQLLALREEHARVFRELQRVSEELTRIIDHERERAEEAERLRENVATIEGVDPQPGEEETLRTSLTRLGNMEALRAASEAARQVLSSDGEDPFVRDAQALLADAIGSLEGAPKDTELEMLSQSLRSAQVQIAEIASDLARYTSGLDEEGPGELARVSARMDEVTSLTRRFGSTIEEVLDYATTARERLTELGSDQLRIEQLTAEQEELGAKQGELAEQLTAARKEAAKELGERVTLELHALALPDATLTVSVAPKEATTDGADAVELLLAPHRGSDFRPVHRGASGGELSRIMLALEVTIAEVDPVPTFVFDEVDAGVGGEAAIEIGRRLRRLAKTSQVIVVTHLAQVAAFAHHHVSVSKDSQGDFTVSSCQRVEGQARLAEMARLLSGISDSHSALEHAAELLSLPEDHSISPPGRR